MSEDEKPDADERTKSHEASGDFAEGERTLPLEPEGDFAEGERHEPPARAATSARASRRSRPAGRATSPRASARSRARTEPLRDSPSLGGVGQPRRAVVEVDARDGSPRVRTPTLSKIAFRWSWTVYGDTKSRRAISAVARPLATSWVTARSRGQAVVAHEHPPQRSGFSWIWRSHGVASSGARCA